VQYFVEICDLRINIENLRICNLRTGIYNKFADLLIRISAPAPAPAQIIFLEIPGKLPFLT
jgi:hypothetical protein